MDSVKGYEDAPEERIAMGSGLIGEENVSRDLFYFIFNFFLSLRYLYIKLEYISSSIIMVNITNSFNRIEFSSSF